MKFLTLLHYWQLPKGKRVSLNHIYLAVGISKQGFYKQRIQYNSKQEEERFLIDIVLQIRKDHPTMCCRAMYYKINPLYYGRDRFIELCRSYGFVSTGHKNSRRTTNSSGVRRFDNLLKGLFLSDIDQAWSSDITYFEIEGIFFFITFILDCYSRRIIGHKVSSRLKTEQTTMPAIQQAIQIRKKEKGCLRKGIIFHSDGGGQYYYQGFLKLTSEYGFKSSMCFYSYENSKAERVNGVIKNNYLKHWCIKTVEDLIKSVDRAVLLYNEDKPHKSLARRTPKQFEQEISILQEQAQQQGTIQKPIMTELQK